MARNTTQLIYQAIRIEGGLIPADELARLTTLQTPDKTEQTDGHYRIPKGLKLRDEVARFWKIGQSLWSDFQTLRQRNDLDAYQATVRNFLVPLLRDVLGFTDLVAGATVEASGHTYNIGYAAREGRLPIVLAGHTQLLDAPAERFGELNPDTGKTRRRSPFMLVQEALNASDQSLWAITSNGLTLRILHDNPSLTRPAYVEVDLEALFSEDLYADFTAFWLLAHASRFGIPEAESTDCPWERWRAAGQEAGVTIRSNLRYQVADALRALGTGFLSHPSNTHLREQLQNQEQFQGLSKQAFFEELLRLVYRLIFLATVEDRTDASTGQSLIFTPGSTKEAQRRYRAGYSITWLRDRAVRRSSFDTHSDLWQALSITFDGLAQGQSSLGLPALGGLYAADQCPNLAHAHIENRWLLKAIFQLGYFRQTTGLTRVNYRDMGPEELGSVYESLLELVPDIQSLSQPHAAKLAFVGDDDIDASTQGNTRKLTGSYYTPDGPVQELIKSALEPVIADTVKANPQQPVEALLQLTVCDLACGSGHFLLAAARRLADEVAKLRAPDGAPTPADYRHALRDVVSHCIYGVDKNPMAIALAKTALWLEAYTPDMPLTFLDHHLQVGDALLGVLDPKILNNGIPDAAYAVLSGDDKATAAALKKQNKADLKSWKEVAAGDMFQASPLAAQADAVEHLPDDSLESIAAKRSAWAQSATTARHSTLARLADTYVAAFLAPKVPGNIKSIPLSGYLWELVNGAGAVNADIDSAADHLCRTHSVFHWWLAFPQVAAKGGFSVMLANPPWERIKLQEEEFFANRSPLVAMAKNKSERGKRIELLRQGLLLHTLYPDVEAAEGLHPPSRAEMRLHEEFIMARRGAEAASLYAHDSGRFPLTGVGDVNTYALFAESVYQLIAPAGRAGFIVPTGIATDDSTKAFFGDISQRGRLVSLYDFENSSGIFPSVHRSFKFSLITLGSALAAEFVCFATQVSHLIEPQRRFTLTPEEFRLINPNTGTCPIFRSQWDAALTKKLYRAAPVLIAEGKGEGELDVNPWGIRFSAMFHMSADSGLFRDTPAASGEPPRLPLYEAKMIHQFDHRWATYVDAPDKLNGLDTADLTDAQRADPSCTVRPRYWVDQAQVLARIARVPSRVASAWLVWHETALAPDATSNTSLDPVFLEASKESSSKLTLALAGWVAGEIFRHSAGQPTQASATDKPGWSTAVAWKATQTAEAVLANQHPTLAMALKQDNTSGKKALPAFTKWALQDADVGLSDAELAELEVLQKPPTTNVAGSATVSIAAHASSTWTRGTFGLDFMDAWMDRRSPRWLMGWRDICRATDERTVIASVVPRVGVGHTMPLLYSTQPPHLQAAMLGNWSSLIFDYIARQKVGGTHLTYGYLKQFPVIPPDRYTAVDLEFIVPRVLELTHTANDMQAWSDDLAAYDPRPLEKRTTPFGWHPERRAQLRSELDTYYANLYGLTRDELRYILDPADAPFGPGGALLGLDYPSETFRGLKSKEERAFGEYRTRRLVLEAWDSWAADAVSLPGYSEHGVISNKSDADLAGLIAAIIQQSAAGISVVDIQAAIVHSRTAATYLEAAEAARLDVLATTVAALSLDSALTSIPPIVQRLEASGAMTKRRAGDTNLYSAGAGALPADVISRPEHVELAQLMLLLEGRRASARSELGGDTEQDRLVQGNR
ncbi:Eco57I restriction-modification methylase domain-containing protein [Polaromonas sp. AET17H-212]|uniref:Eco57I restriction-modification methylase domain-containing protein n=1 Tax=Polaromonas sp. AET17H-212 TaxID=1977061 RepID=UPI000BBBF66A|nr:N-6 DNA methylase [Polaromonas sp. AET17H-212]